MSPLNATFSFFVSAAALGLSLVGFSQHASATVLYDQPWDGGTGNIYASQNDTSTGGIGNFATAFDDFTLGSTATITNVAWTGAYYNPQTQGTITGFTLQIYSDKSGVPGASLYSVTVPGTANETSLGSPGGLGLFFSYNASVNFAATGGVEYWLSLVPDLGFPPQWGWATGTGGDGSSYEIFMSTTGNFTGPQANDLAFTLSSTDTATPLPSTWTMLIAGFVGLGFVAYCGSKKNSTSLAIA